MMEKSSCFTHHHMHLRAPYYRGCYCLLYHVLNQGRSYFFFDFCKLSNLSDVNLLTESQPTNDDVE